MSAIRDAAVRLLAEALQLDPARVDDETTLGVTPEWDSLAHLRLVFGIEARFGRQLSPDEIVSLANLRDVVSLLERHR